MMRRVGVAAGMLVLGACASAGRASTGAESSPGAPLPSVADMAARELTADQQVRQAVDRLGFGARPGEYEAVRSMGVDRWIALQLEPERIDDHVTDTLMRRFPLATMSPEELVRAYPPPALPRAARRRVEAHGATTRAPDADDSLRRTEAARASRRVLTDLQAAKVARAVTTRRQLQEVMVDFWENHFNVFAGKGPERYMLAAYERDAIRPHALGKFRDLLEAVAKSPAMLYYLDNWESSAGRLNENYGRELMELHTLGVDGGYTQQDVIAAARAFTGWSIRAPRRGGGFAFRPGMHDSNAKRFLGRTLPAGRGIEDGEEVLDILARSPSTARFIATKLVRHFVSDSAPPALVDRAAATFTRTDGDVREVLRTIFTSPEFFSRAAYRSKVKTPFELVVSALRAVDARPDTTPRTASIIARLGEPIFGHRDPNGYPDVGESWINTGAILERINFGMAVGRGRIPGVSLRAWADAQRLDALPHEEQVDGVIREVLGGEASSDTRTVLESGVNPLADAGRSDGAAARMRGPSPAALPELVGLALGAPEFQRR